MLTAEIITIPVAFGGGISMDQEYNEMEQEQPEDVRHVSRQSWKPGRVLRTVRGSWNVVYSIIKIILAAVATVVAITVICLFAFINILADYLETDILPNSELVMEDFDQTGNSYMYYLDAQGEIQVLQRLHKDIDSDWVSYDQIPENLIYAAVAIEDHRFFEHQGVDWIPTIKACVNMFIGGAREFGGSSITQQLIKNLLLEYDESADDVTVQRKVQEIFRATEFEKRYSKEFILEWYLNKIYLGNRCQGIKPAAAEYFGKELDDLNAAECAALISITNNPSLFNPYRETLDDYKGEQLNGMERNKRRREDTLFMMKEYGWLSEEEYEQALIDSENIVLKRGIDEEDKYYNCPKDDCDYRGKIGTYAVSGDSHICPACNRVVAIGSDATQEVYSWFVDVVLEDVAKALCERAGYDWNTPGDAGESLRADYKRLVCQSGYHIYTTLDMRVQNQVDKIYTDLSQIPDTNSIQQLESGIVVIDNKTGDIVAMAGGVGQKVDHDAYSCATDAKLQPGSSMKPLAVYAPAFELGVLTPASVVKDLPFYYTDDPKQTTATGEAVKVPFPRNDDREYQYSRTVLQGITSSVNAVSINSLDIMGLEYSFNFAKDRFGLSTLVKTYVNSSGKIFSDVGWAPLGMGAPTIGVTVRDMSNAYATFANEGVYREARTYSLVYNSDGELILNNEQDSREILSEKAVNYINYCLDSAVEYGTGTGAEFRDIEFDICGKTGSTASYRDRWFCGYTSEYTAAVWCGYRNPEAITGLNPSGNPASLLWRKVLEPLHKNLESEPLYDESKLIEVSVCLDCGKLATETCLRDIRTAEYGITRVAKAMVYQEDAPTESCDCHILVDYCPSCKTGAHDGCTFTVQRALVKMTESQVEDIYAASKAGLWQSHSGENYIYLVDKKGNPIPFYGFEGDKNKGVESPYLICTVHSYKTPPKIEKEETRPIE